MWNHSARPAGQEYRMNSYLVEVDNQLEQDFIVAITKKISIIGYGWEVITLRLKKDLCGTTQSRQSTGTVFNSCHNEKTSRLLDMAWRFLH